jgi:F-box/leucine-rich repeat protein 2/20
VRLIDSDVIHVINKLEKQLTALVLDGTDITDVAYSYLKNCARLQELEVQFCSKMTERGLLDGIGSLHELTHLRLNMGRNLTAQALSTFLRRPFMTSIVLLDLTCLNLDDEGLKGIAERCIHLRKLEITRCENVTDAGFRMVINHCSKLRVLVLKCLYSVRGEGWLALVPSCLPQLRKLYLLSCNVVGKYVEELRAAVPELEVIK